MTQKQYEDKLSILETSDAPYAIKEKAIADLRAKYEKSTPSKTTAMQQFLDSSPDISDFRGGT